MPITKGLYKGCLLIALSFFYYYVYTIHLYIIYYLSIYYILSITGQSLYEKDSIDYWTGQVIKERLLNRPKPLTKGFYRLLNQPIIVIKQRLLNRPKPLTKGLFKGCWLIALSFFYYYVYTIHLFIIYYLSIHCTLCCILGI